MLNCPITNIVVSEASSSRRRIILWQHWLVSALVSASPPPCIIPIVRVLRHRDVPGAVAVSAISRCFRTETSIQHQSPLILPTHPPSLQHDKYINGNWENGMVIDKPGPAEDRGFILHINYLAIFHYSYSDNTGLLGLFWSLVFSYHSIWLAVDGLSIIELQTIQRKLIRSAYSTSKIGRLCRKRQCSSFLCHQKSE